MLIKRTKERSPEITPDNRGVIWGKELTVWLLMKSFMGNI